MTGYLHIPDDAQLLEQLAIAAHDWEHPDCRHPDFRLSDCYMFAHSVLGVLRGLSVEPTDRRTSSFKIGEWWVADKRGQGKAHRISAIEGVAPEPREASSLNYDYRLWSSVCGRVRDSAVLFSMPSLVGHEHCADCASAPVPVQEDQP